jgi:hypothetical protein
MTKATTPMTPEQAKALEEGSKLFHDTFKHLTSLTTGSVIILVAFFEKFKGLQYRELAIVALCLFILVTIGCVLLMLFLAKDVAIGGVPTPLDTYFRLGAILMVSLFFLGFIVLVIFAALNLYYIVPK